MEEYERSQRRRRRRFPKTIEEELLEEAERIQRYIEKHGREPPY